MYQRLIFYIGMLFQHVNVSAEIQKTGTVFKSV